MVLLGIALLVFVAGVVVCEAVLPPVSRWEVGDHVASIRVWRRGQRRMSVLWPPAVLVMGLGILGRDWDQAATQSGRLSLFSVCIGWAMGWAMACWYRFLTHALSPAHWRAAARLLRLGRA